MGALDQLVRDGKVRYVGVSNYAGWQLMKALGIAEREHLSRFVSQQIYYSAAQVALAWLLTRPTVSSVVIGARTDEQLADNLRAASLTLSGSELDRLERVSRPPLLYPYWHQLMSSPDRLSPADLSLIGPYLDE